MQQRNNPLHGITLETLLRQLVEQIGWQQMAQAVPLRCFSHDPSISSSLHFLRRTPWARSRVEELYLQRIVHPSQLAHQRPPTTPAKS